MPLVNKQTFKPNPVPSNIGPGDEVFYHELTNEIFTSHAEFFDRFLYCNSLIWTCSRTGKSGLTYKEALDSEQQDCVKKKKRGRKPAEQTNGDGSEPVKKKKKKYPYDPKKYSMPVPEGIDPSLLTPTGKIDGRKLKSKKNKELADELMANQPQPEPQSKGKKGKHKKVDDEKSREEEARRKEEEIKKKAELQAELARQKELEAKKKKEAAALAKQLERQKREEEKKKQTAFLQTWEKKCEDLTRDDLRRLPQPIPVDCDLPQKQFGDALFIMESLFNLHELYEFNKLYESGGMSFDTLEEVLLERQEGSAIGPLVSYLLRLIFDIQPTKDGYGFGDEDVTNLPQDEDTTIIDDGTSFGNIKNEGANAENHNTTNGLGSEADEDEEDDEENVDKEVNMNDLIGSAIKAAQEVKKSLSRPLPEMEITLTNVTDILRLHLLQSGSFPKGRTIFNGWYSCREDPGLWLCMQEPDLIKKLGETTIYDLEIDERIKILHTLIYQLFSFRHTRLYIESASEQLTELRKKYRYEVAAFGKWDRENCVKRNHPQANEGQGDHQDPEQSIQQTNVDYEDYQRERAIRQEQLNQLLLEIRDTLRKNQAVYGIHPIGRDRAYRRYWIFQSINGLFVEQDDEYVGHCLPEPTPMESRYKKLFNKENPLMHTNEADLIRIKTTDASCSTESDQLTVPVKSPETSSLKGQQQYRQPQSHVQNDHQQQKPALDPKKEVDESNAGGNHQNGFDKQNGFNQVKDENHNSANDNKQMNGDHDDQDDQQDEQHRYIPDEMNYCTGNEETCCVHGKRRPKEPRWWFYYKPESIDSLTDSLNKRGHRESELQFVLSFESSIIKECIAKCPAYKLNRFIPAPAGRRSRRIITRGGGKRRVKVDFE